MNSSSEVSIWFNFGFINATGTFSLGLLAVFTGFCALVRHRQELQFSINLIAVVVSDLVYFTCFGLNELPRHVEWLHHHNIHVCRLIHLFLHISYRISIFAILIITLEFCDWMGDNIQIRSRKAHKWNRNALATLLAILLLFNCWLLPSADASEGFCLSDPGPANIYHYLSIMNVILFDLIPTMLGFMLIGKLYMKLNEYLRQGNLEFSTVPFSIPTDTEKFEKSQMTIESNTEQLQKGIQCKWAAFELALLLCLIFMLSFPKFLLELTSSLVKVNGFHSRFEIITTLYNVASIIRPLVTMLSIARK